ncbi:hypothetical protein SSTU70S_00929 [Stutzerimonas stutzeri]
MAGHIDHLVAAHGVLQRLDMADADAVVDLVPEPGQHDFEKAHGGVGVVRGDLVGVAQRAGFGLVEGDVLARGFLADRLAHLRAVHQPLHQVAPVRQVRADHRSLLIAEVHAQHAVHHAQGTLVALVLRHQLVELDRRGELHARLAPQHQDAEQLAQAPGDRPAVGEQQLPGAGLAVRRLPPEHADRDDLRVLHRVVLQRADQPHQGRRGDQPGTPAEPARRRVEKEERRRLDMLAHRHIGYRARQPGLGALDVEHRQIAQRRLLQHVEHRLAAIELEGEGGLVDGFRTHPEVQQAAQRGEDQTANGGAGHALDSTVERGRALEGRKCDACGDGGQNVVESARPGSEPAGSLRRRSWALAFGVGPKTTKCEEPVLPCLRLTFPSPRNFNPPRMVYGCRNPQFATGVRHASTSSTGHRAPGGAQSQDPRTLSGDDGRGGQRRSAARQAAVRQLRPRRRRLCFERRQAAPAPDERGQRRHRLGL